MELGSVAVPSVRVCFVALIGIDMSTSADIVQCKCRRGGKRCKIEFFLGRNETSRLCGYCGLGNHENHKLKRKRIARSGY